MISIRYAAIMTVAALVTGAFVSSPELRAYAAATIGSGDIIDESIRSEDIKNGQVKAADIGSGAVRSSEIATDAVGSDEIATDAVGPTEIAADAVGASEIAGVSKLIFAECTITDSTLVAGGNGLLFNCTVTGAEPGDNLIATINGEFSGFALSRSRISTSDNVEFTVINAAGSAQVLGTVTFSIIIYNT